MKRLLTLPFFLFCYSVCAQTAVCRITEKTEFIGTWTLFEIRNGSNKKLTDQVEQKMLILNEDSVFVIIGEKLHRGTWTFDNQQIHINVEGDPAFDYKWAIKNSNFICFRRGDDMSRLECFKKGN